MKTAISLPDRLFRSAEQLAARLGVSRSELYSKALDSFMEKHRDDLITARLNEVYGPGGSESSVDRTVTLLQHRSLGREKW
jgi:hypothetical protein